MTIDIHHHYAPKALLEAADRNPTGFLARGIEAIREPVTAIDARIEEMDECGLDRAVLSVPLLDAEALTQRASALALSRACNDELIGIADQHPDRFSVLVGLPFPSAQHCLEELRRVAAEPAVDGVIVHTDLKHWTLDERRFEAVLAEIAARRMPVLLHPAGDQFEPTSLFAEWGLKWSLVLLMETSLTAARLMLSGTLDRVPDLLVVVPHLGGILPYAAQRLIDLSGTGAAEHDVTHYLRHRVVMDTCSYHRPAIETAIATSSADRIMLGSDYPGRGSLGRMLADVSENEALPESARAAILADNAQRFGFGRARSTPAASFSREP